MSGECERCGEHCMDCRCMTQPTPDAVTDPDLIGRDIRSQILDIIKANRKAGESEQILARNLTTLFRSQALTASRPVDVEMCEDCTGAGDDGHGHTCGTCNGAGGYPSKPVDGSVERERAEKLAELYSWTGSAWLAGEDDEDRRPELYSFLCSLIGWFQPVPSDAVVKGEE